MSDQIDPAFKAAYRETQGQPVDAVGRDTQVIAKPSIHLAKLMSFEKDGHQGIFDIIDGKFDYTGDLPVSDAARLLFETLADYMSEWWFERAATKTALAEKDARIEALLAADEVRVRDISRLTVERDEARAECEGLRAKLEKFVAAHALECKQRLAAEADKARSIEALTPSGNTKAAYIGEFHFDYTVWDPHGEDEITHRVSVPWGTIKEIMAAIRARAALSQKETGDE
jgi:hypothetical protein